MKKNYLYVLDVVCLVIVNQQSSKTFNLNYGVSQGSCLGPVRDLSFFYCMHQGCLRLLRSTFHQFMGTLMILSCTCRFVQIRLLFKIKRLRLLRSA